MQSETEETHTKGMDKNMKVRYNEDSNLLKYTYIIILLK